MSSPPPPWPALGLPSMPPTSFSDTMLWRSWPWSLLKFLIRSRATIQALSRLTGRAEAVGRSGRGVARGGGSGSFLSSFPGSTTYCPYPLGQLAQLFQIVKVPGGSCSASHGELWIASKMPTLPPHILPLMSLPSQRLSPESLCQSLDSPHQAAS